MYVLCMCVGLIVNESRVIIQMSVIYCILSGRNCNLSDLRLSALSDGGTETILQG